MKTLIIAIAFSMISLGAFCQQANTGNKGPAGHSGAMTNAVLFKCPVCGASSTKAGECPKDKVAMVKVGDYYCPDCYMSSNKAGKCSMCGVDMKKMTANFTPTK